MASNRLETIKLQLLAIRVLRALKPLYSYRELAKLVGLPPSMLCRYTRGSTIPSPEHAKRIVEYVLEEGRLRDIVLRKLDVKEGYIDTRPVFSDSSMLFLVSAYLAKKYGGAKVTKVLVPEARGIPLATAIALELDAQLVIARRVKDNPYEDYIESIALDNTYNPIYFYVPRKHISYRDRVLIVDDLVESGQTLRALLAIVEHCKAKLVGVFILVAVGGAWRKNLDVEAPVEAVLELSRPLARNPLREIHFKNHYEQSPS
ncbi:MAG TPA: helix-turn-helix domain-containing protein [Pyrodictium sp.]|nr:helix-turn-helix domain-containing protein [Pyrodictium sp.]